MFLLRKVMDAVSSFGATELEVVMMDFETALWTAFRTQLPQVRSYCCFSIGARAYGARYSRLAFSRTTPVTKTRTACCGSCWLCHSSLPTAFLECSGGCAVKFEVVSSNAFGRLQTGRCTGEPYGRTTPWKVGKTASIFFAGTATFSFMHY